MKLIDLVHSEGDKGSYLPSLLELTQALGGLVADVEGAKRFSNDQLDLLDKRLSESNTLIGDRDKVIEEKDEVIKEMEEVIEEKGEFIREAIKEKDECISEVIDERDEALGALAVLRDQLEINLKEKEQLSQQVSDLRTQLQELEKARKEILEARHQSELVLLQLGQVQEELEHYFLLSRHQSELLKANEDLQARFALLLSNAAH